MNNEFDYYPQSEQSFFEQTPFPLQSTGHAKGYSYAALWLGIASALCAFCCCFYLLAPVLACISIVMACKARRDNARRMTGAATAGLVLSIVGLVLFAIILTFDLIMLAIPESEFREMIRTVIEDSYGVSFEEYIDAIRSELE